MTNTRALAPVALALLAVTACSDDAHFTVKTAPDLRPMTVSVLGVFKEGRLTPEAWDELGPKLSPAFGKAMCPIGYDAKLMVDQPELAEAVNDYSRANGVTDDLLDQLSPAANGDSVLVITVAGRPLKQKNDQSTLAPPTSMNTHPGQMPGRRGGSLPPPTMGRLVVNMNAYEMSASLFSIRDHRSVALVTMGYGGESADEAIAKFVAKLRGALPGFPCVGWHSDPPLDAKKVRELKGE